MGIEGNIEWFHRLSEVHESLQAEMLAQLTQDLKERLLSEGMLNKLVLINIAAEAYAAKKWSGMFKFILLFIYWVRVNHSLQAEGYYKQ